MLRFQLHMKFAAEACDEASTVLRSLVGPVRAEPGCSATHLFRAKDDDRALTWVEEWRSARDFEDHLHTTAFRRILAVMDLAADEPNVEIDEVVSRRGFDLVEAILRPTDAVEGGRNAG